MIFQKNLNNQQTNFNSNNNNSSNNLTKFKEIFKKNKVKKLKVKKVYKCKVLNCNKNKELHLLYKSILHLCIKARNWVMKNLIEHQKKNTLIQDPLLQKENHLVFI